MVFFNLDTTLDFLIVLNRFISPLCLILKAFFFLFTRFRSSVHFGDVYTVWLFSSYCTCFQVPALTFGSDLSLDLLSSISPWTLDEISWLEIGFLFPHGLFPRFVLLLSSKHKNTKFFKWDLHHTSDFHSSSLLDNLLITGLRLSYE